MIEVIDKKPLVEKTLEKKGSSLLLEIFFGQGKKKKKSPASPEASRNRLPTPEGKTWKRVIVASNRLPFKVNRDTEGKLSTVISSGGLVTAMSPLLREGVAGKWVGWSGTEEEEGLEEALRSAPNGSFDVGVVNLTSEEEEKYYEGFSNKVLCPLFEGILDQVDFAHADEYWPTYQDVQKKFAEKIQEDLRPGDIIWIQDYHLAGVGKALSDKGVQQPMGYFLHMPFPKMDDYALLPHREEFLRDLLAYDVIGLQTQVFKKNFLDAVHAYIPDALVEKISDSVTLVRIGGRTIRVGNFPISIDSKEFLEQREEPETKAYAKQLEKDLRKDGQMQMIFNAGRLDYTKGFYEELLAFDRLLEKHPELIGKIILYQLVIPSRESIPAYKEYKDDIIQLAEKINAKYKSVLIPGATSESQESFIAYEEMPVRQVHAHMDRPIYLAHVMTADIQSVPTKADGMNLVAKEGAVVGKPGMVQVLGKAAGAAEELGEHALLIDPTDTESFADTLYEAYVMTEEEKLRRKNGLAEAVKENDVFSWWTKEQEPAFQAVWNEKTST